MPSRSAASYSDRGVDLVEQPHAAEGEDHPVEDVRGAGPSPGDLLVVHAVARGHRRSVVAERRPERREGLRRALQVAWVAAEEVGPGEAADRESLRHPGDPSGACPVRGVWEGVAPYEPGARTLAPCEERGCPPQHLVPQPGVAADHELVVGRDAGPRRGDRVEPPPGVPEAAAVVELQRAVPGEADLGMPKTVPRPTGPGHRVEGEGRLERADAEVDRFREGRALRGTGPGARRGAGRGGGQGGGTGRETQGERRGEGAGPSEWPPGAHDR